MENIKKIYGFIFDNILILSWIASILMLSGAYGFEYIGGLVPCDLCWPQRYAHMAVIVFGAFALYFKKLNPIKWQRFKVLTCVSWAVSVGYSGYHAGVEQKWWEGPDSCTMQASDMGLTFESFQRSLENTTFIRCDEIPWEMFGISMAGYNFLISLGCFIMLSLSLRKDLAK
ncbi:disulfide bond formation protein B [Pseudemcibacter aquimaris]|uniref:disulfide bond formation protein B n=1 Tax=Pseudemcibacter aquimaris TaxID=2857064 RepID=UPI002012DC7B|nr:disulfide bond formation protein B [Pseudemcibacter aquimaris]MCC3862088.1 disulfide bond formation protein B [Pseudemcibacter aquimaris]WDU58841.1 disulfide bond formation protein B [Pseudemcibacter aquimaris]